MPVSPPALPTGFRPGGRFRRDNLISMGTVTGSGEALPGRNVLPVTTGLKRPAPLPSPPAEAVSLPGSIALAVGAGGAVGDAGAAKLPSPALTGLQSLQQPGPEAETAGQVFAGPSIGRQGIGARVPPSLAALLRPKVY